MNNVTEKTITNLRANTEYVLLLFDNAIAGNNCNLKTFEELERLINNFNHSPIIKMANSYGFEDWQQFINQRHLQNKNVKAVIILLSSLKVVVEKECRYAVTNMEIKLLTKQVEELTNERNKNSSSTISK